MKQGLKIAITSSRSGVGKSFIAVNLYAYLNQLDDLTCELIDAHVQRPSLKNYFHDLPKADLSEVNVRIPEIDIDSCTFCGRCVQYCNYNAILMLKESNHIKVIDDYCTSCGACVYACNDNAIKERTELLGLVSKYDKPNFRLIEGKALVIRPMTSPVIAEINREINDSKLSIIDTPPGNSFAFLESIKGVDYVVVVTDDSEKGLKGLIKKIEILEGLEKRFGVVINAYKKSITSLEADLQKQRISVLAKIPYDIQLAKMISEGALIDESNTVFKVSIQSISNAIIRVNKEGAL